jgi:asparagine synthase (glutamine-hydrolysing)
MQHQLLRDTDWASMAHSLEVRVPLVCPLLLKSTARQFAGGHIRNGKELLAQAAINEVSAWVRLGELDSSLPAE